MEKLGSMRRCIVWASLFWLYAACRYGLKRAFALSAHNTLL